jgi:ATP-dependent RNA helicase DeaD
MDPGRERRELSSGAHIVVGTPGRLRDHLERRALNVSSLKAVVLDEADEMLDMGFREDLQFILETTPAERRTLLFSATLPKTIVTLAMQYQKDALRIATRGESSGHADIEYRAVRIAGNKIERGVVNLLRFLDPPGALVFCGTRERVRHIAAQLMERGFAAVAMSGELSQSERNHALQALRDGRARVCVATDVAARGIDLPNLALVIHADLPNDAAVLQHRSGRTGRAGKKGISVLLVPPSRRRRVEEMLRKARVTASWGEAPSAAAIRKLDQERLLKNPVLTEAASDSDLAMADELLQSSDARTIAAAFVKIFRAGLPAPEDIEEDVPIQKHEPRENKSRGHKERGHTDFDRKPRKHPPHTPRGGAPRAPRDGDMQNGVWFRLNVGRERNADPKWLLPEICRQGNLTKKDIGAIRVFEMETLFQVSAEAAANFTTLVGERKKGGVRISPASNQSGESTARPRTALAPGSAPGDAPPRKPGFHGKRLGDNPGKKKYWPKKSRQKKPGKKKLA